MTARIGRLAVIGVGLIGGSLALALRRAGAVGEVVGCGRRAATLERAEALGIIDRAVAIPEAAATADMVVVCVPLGAVRGVFEAMAGVVGAETVVTDAGSAKSSVIADAEAVFGEVPPWLIPGHPIAGTEKSGPEAAFPDLYQGRRVILTPAAAADPRAVERVRAMWEAAGAGVVTMDAAHHDEVLAATSHLPHVLAYGLVDALSRWDDRREIFEFAAGGFRDFTRIASSDPTMWRDICIANRGPLSAALRRYLGELEWLADRLEAGDAEALQTVFDRARAERERFLALLEGRSAP